MTGLAGPEGDFTMTRTKAWTARLLVLPVALALCALDGAAWAQSTADDGRAGTAPATSGGQANRPGMVDPSRGPLQPVPPAAENPPDAPSASAAPSAQGQSQGSGTQPPPAGTAVGQRGETSGGAASRPAGMAIAPAKQHQYRSLLIKVGLVAAAGIAVGTVVALTKSSPSKPPGAP